MRDFIHRVFLPLTLPLVSMVVIALIVLNFSRILLAVNKTTAAEIALIVAALVLLGSTYFSAAGRPGSAMNVAAPVGFVTLLTLGGVIALSSQHPKHGGPGPEVPANSTLTVTAKDTSFVQKTLSAIGPNVKVVYANDDPQEHTLVFDGVPGFKLDNKKGGGATVDGVAKLPAGQYTFFCDIPGHRQAGMEGKLVVTEAGATGTPAPAQAAPAAGGTATTKLQIAAEEDPKLQLDPAALTAPAGTIDITYANKGSALHTLAIDGVVDFKELKVAKTGASDHGTVKLNKGVYLVYCTVPGHRAAGMESRLTVT
jgi:plastocyanin